MLENNPGWPWFCFATFCDWFQKLSPPGSQPIRCKTKTNRDLVARVFPRLVPVTWICLELSLVHCVVYVCCDWPLYLLWFGFYDTQMETSLFSLWKDKSLNYFFFLCEPWGVICLMIIFCCPLFAVFSRALTVFRYDVSSAPISVHLPVSRFLAGKAQFIHRISVAFQSRRM